MAFAAAGHNKHKNYRKLRPGKSARDYEWRAMLSMALVVCVLATTVLAAHDALPINQANTATVVVDQSHKEVGASYVTHYLAQQYRDARLLKRLSFNQRNGKIKEIVASIARQCGLSVVMPTISSQRVARLCVADKPAGTILHALLAGQAKKWAILIVDDVLHVAPYAQLQRRARLLLEGGMLSVKTACIPITHMPWHETVKMRLEAMWHHCTREHSSSRRRQYFFLDDASKQVLVQGSVEQVAQFTNMVRALDVAQPQVQLSARVILVHQHTLAGLGFRAKQQHVSIDAIPSLLPECVTLPFVFGGSDASMKHLSLVLQLAEQRKKIRTLLAPHVLSASGQQAQLLEGQHVPIESATSHEEQGQFKTIRSAQYKEVGVQLKVTPQVLAGSSLIRLNVLVEHSQVAATSTSKHYPTLTTSRIKNVITVRSGQMVLLGGLVKTQQEVDRQGVPWLSRVPLIGWLFGGHAQRDDAQRLYVVLRAVIQD